MKEIFICYRREDSSGHSGRLYDRLIQHFGKERVFLDVGRIRIGDDFVKIIDRAVSDSRAMIVVIGEDWLAATDASGRRRLDDHQDYVRTEIAAGLRKSIRVIPVLVQQAKMPKAEELPEDLRPLSTKQALEISETRWDYDVGLLIDAIEEELKQAADQQTDTGGSSQKTIITPAPPPPPPPIPRWLIVLALIILASLGGWWGIYQLRPAETIMVPDVKGKPLEEAQQIIVENGLAKGMVSQVQMAGRPLGIVLAQKPGPGFRARRNQAIDLQIVAAPDSPPTTIRPLKPRPSDFVRMPDLIGKQLKQVETILAEQGLAIGRIGREPSPDHPADTVIGQNFPRGTNVRTGARIDLVVTQTPVPFNLRITRCKFNKNNYLEGEPVVVTYSLRSEGHLPSNVGMGVFIGSGPNGEWRKWPLSDSYSNELNLQREITDNRPIEMPRWGPGAYSLMLHADPDNNLLEPNREDNVCRMDVTVIPQTGPRPTFDRRELRYPKTKTTLP
jgi:hypothetical protein